MFGALDNAPHEVVDDPESTRPTDVPTDEERPRPRTDTTTARTHELNLYHRYLDLVAAGRKAIEVRVRCPHLASMAAGDTIRFRIKGPDETCDVLGGVLERS